MQREERGRGGGGTPLHTNFGFELVVGLYGLKVLVGGALSTYSSNSLVGPLYAGPPSRGF